MKLETIYNNKQSIILDVDNSTGWPWYAANLPPADFYDCLFIYFSCTDFEKPGQLRFLNFHLTMKKGIS